MSTRLSSLWLLIALVLGVVIFGDLTRRMTDAHRMQREGERLAVEVARLEESNAKLEDSIAHASDDANVSRWARSEAKMVREGERLVFPISPDDPIIAPVEVPEAAVDPPSPFEVWLALLLGITAESP